MKVKNFALACALIATYGAASAADQVAVYGVVDIAAYRSQYMLNQDPEVAAPADPFVSKYAKGSVTGLTNGGMSMSRIGFKGTEDLGGGLKAVFTLEDRFLPNNGVFDDSVGSVTNVGSAKNPLTSGGDGSVAGQLFNGQANVGLSSATMGSVVFGRVLDLGADAVGTFDPMKGSLIFSPLGYSGQFAGGGFTEDARSDNTIKYTNQSGAFNYGFMYKLGGQAGAASAQSAIGLSFGYSSGSLALQATWERYNDAVSAGPGGIGALSLTFADTTGTMLNASYQFERVKLYGGYELMTYNTPSNSALDAATSSWFGNPVTAVNTTAFAIERKQSMAWLGGTYSVSSTFDLTGALYQAHQNDFSGGACALSENAAASCSGNSRFVSLMTDYKLSKRTDLYAGYMYNRVSGGYDTTGTVHDSNSIIAAGMRHAF